MPNSDKRIEIAERMRGPFDVCECVGHTYLSGTLFGMQVCATDELALRNGMRYLADLIDPTCKVEDDNRWASNFDYVCRACGEHFSTCEKPNYCPGCGARLVSADDAI